MKTFGEKLGNEKRGENIILVRQDRKTTKNTIITSARQNDFFPSSLSIHRKTFEQFFSILSLSSFSLFSLTSISCHITYSNYLHRRLEYKKLKRNHYMTQSHRLTKISNCRIVPYRYQPISINIVQRKYREKSI